jgi:DNA-binding PadR family transcriptional regulator
VRRKPGALIPLEISVLAAAIDLAQRGEAEFHGYQLAREIRHRNGDRYRTAAGTLYKALDRMEQNGLLASRWEDPAAVYGEGRPPRRLYRLTAAGHTACERALAPVPAPPAIRPRTEPA